MGLYQDIKNARPAGRLPKTFSAADCRKACPGYARRTYNTFLSKHAKGNPGGYREYFERVCRGKYQL
jgi:hypothetical protein